MLRQRWVVFAAQVLVVAAVWGLFLVFVARHAIDGWLAVQVIVAGLVVALVNLWRTSQSDKTRGRR